MHEQVYSRGQLLGLWPLMSLAARRGLRVRELGGRNAPPPEAETLLVFGRSLKVANLPTFKKFETQKIKQFLLSLKKNDVYRPQYVTDCLLYTSDAADE